MENKTYTKDDWDSNFQEWKRRKDTRKRIEIENQNKKIEQRKTNEENITNPPTGEQLRQQYQEKLRKEQEKEEAILADLSEITEEVTLMEKVLKWVSIALGAVIIIAIITLVFIL